MRIQYRGHEIEVTSEESLGGEQTLYYSIFRDDGFECLPDFEDSEETVPDKVAQLKERVDNELEEAAPWGVSERLL